MPADDRDRHSFEPARSATLDPPADRIPLVDIVESAGTRGDMTRLFLPILSGFVCWFLAILAAGIGMLGDYGMAFSACGALFPLIAIFMSAFVEHRGVARAVRAARAVERVNYAVVLRSLFSRCTTPQRDLVVDEIVEQCRRGRRFNVTLRLHRSPSSAIVPQTVPFEPIRLGDQSDTCLDEQDDPVIGEKSTRSGRRTFCTFQIRNARDNIAVILILAMFGAVVCIPLLSTGNLTIASFLSYWPLWILLGLLVGFMMSHRMKSVLRASDWLLVPGGLVRRRSAWTLDRWRIHLYERERSILVVRESNPQKSEWEIHVADQDHSEIFSIPEKDLTPLLRAWLSPLTPPNVEQMGDLIG